MTENNSREQVAYLEKQMPTLRILADEMYKDGKISKNRRDFVNEASAADFAYSQMKAEHPEWNWEAWELHA